jgi:hypothetical protein
MEAVLRGATNSKAMMGVVVGVFILPGILGVIGGVSALRADPADVPMGAACLAGGVVLFVLGVLLQRATTRAVEVSASGITMRPKSGNATTIRWDEPHDFFYRGVQMRAAGVVPLGTVVSVRVVTPDRRRIEVSSSAGHNSELPPAIERYSTEASFPLVRARLAGGGQVSFGPVELGSGWVRVDGTTYPVGQVKSMSVYAGVLRLELEGRFFAAKTRIRDIANYPTLLRALAEMKAQAALKTAPGAQA